MRITYLPKQRLVRKLLGLDDMYGEERARFLEVISTTQVVSLVSTYNLKPNTRPHATATAPAINRNPLQSKHRLSTD